MPSHYNTHARRRRYDWWRKNIITAILSLILGFVIFKVLKARLSDTGLKVTHADRYSKEFKYRPAASPIVTEVLDDGTVRLRGANYHDTHAVWRDEL